MTTTDANGYYRASSWSGSESHRRDQGSCPAPFRTANLEPKFLVPSGTPCLVRNLFLGGVRKHTTKQDNGFDRFERRVKNQGMWHYEFRSDIGGWIMDVECFRVAERAR